MDFTRRIELDTPYDDAIPRVKDALKDQGFGVLTEIDVRQTLKDKLNIDIEPQIILGACNPQLAHRALDVDRQIGLLLPCNVVVRRDGDRTVVQALDPQVMVSLPGQPELQGVADEAAKRLGAALEAVAAG